MLPHPLEGGGSRRRPSRELGTPHRPESLHASRRLIARVGQPHDDWYIHLLEQRLIRRLMTSVSLSTKIPDSPDTGVAVILLRSIV